MTDNTVSITVATPSAGANSSTSDIVVTAGTKLAGWTQVSITLRAEGFPPTFHIAAASSAPMKRDDAGFITPGDHCSINIGNDLVITGYVSETSGETEATDHRIDVIGRGKTQDLVDGEITWKESMPYFFSSVESLRTILSYYNLGVITHGDIPALPFEYPILLDYGTPGAEYVNQITRSLGVLAYEGPTGDLILATAGDVTAASGASYGVNVLTCSVTNSMEGRFSEIVACYFRTRQFFATDAEPNFFATATDPGVTRHRVKHVFLQDGPQGEDFAKKMAVWEAARRAARGKLVRVTVDSWRDSAGTLWTPNTIIPVNLPGVSPDEVMCLSEVTFQYDDAGGTRAELLLMAKAGFVPEPVQILTNANLQGVVGAGATAVQQ
ncbi:phage baseplate assembly protein [Sphingomonas sp. BE137]|uniref:phage baseplate assembly protein n=1 Tax=Sphingomonas sp. BE137 TaxID=2817844 RepID=UPI001AE15A5E|nr:hypothetical protein [Sphingomonas sp. BE137]MDR6850366.1 prophage tail gpP-like protein [Sphingomonas sp. BE137]